MINQETRVGLFVLAGIMIFAIAIVFLEDITLQKGYELKIVFDNAEGLPEKGSVKIAGVEVGKVKKINLVQNKALVTVTMKPNVKIHRDAQAKIVSVGMVGNKFLEMTSGSQDEPFLEDGDVIIGASSTSLENIIEIANKGIDKLVGQLKLFEKSGKLGSSLSEIASNLEEITRKLNSSLGKNGKNVKKTLENINTISKRIKKMEIENSVLSKLIDDKKLGKKVENIINSLEKVGKKLEKRF